MKDLRIKSFLAVLAAILLLVPLNMGLRKLYDHYSLGQQIEQSERKIGYVEDLFRQMNEDVVGYNEWFDRDAAHNVRFMAVLLKHFVRGGKYSGPRVFDDGVVVEVRDGKVIYPAAMPDHFIEITPEQIREGLEDPYHYVAMVMAYDPEDPDREDVPYDIEHITDEAAYMADHYLMYVSEIADNVYYVDRTEGSEFYGYMHVLVNDEEIVRMAEKTYGGGFLYIDLRDESLPIRNESSYFAGHKSAAELGLTKELLLERPSVASFNGEDYVCVYRDTTAVGSLLWMYAYPVDRIDTGHDMRLLFIMLVMMGILATLIVYVIAVQYFVRDRRLTEGQIKRYMPKKLRSRAVVITVAGSLIVMFVTAMVQSVGVMHSETSSAKDTLHVFFDQLADNEQHKDTATSEEEANWYVYFGQRLSEMIAEYPELASGTVLQQVCDAVEADYIMLFDSEGRETICNRAYTGFRIEEGEDGYLHDFRRLLMGVPYMVQPAGFDRVTGLNRQLIGVSMPQDGETGMHGAMVMALKPETTSRPMAESIASKLFILAEEGTTCFSADGETGRIRYATDPDLTEGNITDYGLKMDSLHNGYMDFGPVKGRYSYIVTEKRDPYIYYYAAEVSRLFRYVPWYSLVMALGFLIIGLILTAILMHGYNEESFKRLSKVGEPSPEGKVIDVVSEDGKTKLIIDPSKRWIRQFSDWFSMMPEEQAGTVARMALCLVFVIYMYMLSVMNRSGDDTYELFEFIMHGDWARGPNLFAFSAILIVFFAAFLVVIVSKRVLQTLSGFLDSKGETVCRLLLNFIQYIMVFAVIYNIFSYLGFPTGTVLASLGLVTLALSLGAQSMVSDILAGIAIVFEGEFQVGDIVVIEGFQGTIQEIGVRTTKIIDPGGDIKIINNNNIKNVVNKARLNSWYAVQLTVPATESLLKIEEILNRELPKIGSRYPEIISGPKYLGVNGLNDRQIVPQTDAMTLIITTECKEKDIRTVKRAVNREIKLLCEREHIPLL